MPDWIGRFQNRRHDCSKRGQHALTPPGRVFPRPFTHGGNCPPPYGGDKCRRQSVNGGTHEGGHKPYGGDLTLIDYIIN